jgi:TetR/AcrR family transcriptional repressor of nem operon
MPRPREFDEEKALDRAMRVFWRQGYEATSMQDLLRAMRLSKSSFYETFRGKRTCFLRSLERFERTQAVQAVIDVDADVPARTTIARILGLLVERAVDERHGCMFGKSAVELAHRDPQVRRRAATAIKGLEDTFHRIVRRGQKTGEIERARDARALARSLTATFYGLQVMGNADVSRAVLRDVVRTSLAALD